MRVVLQRTGKASVTVDGETVGRINKGYVLLVGVTHEDTEKDAVYLADKIAGLRIFEDENGKMNKSLAETGGEILSVSQFTLYGDTKKGRRPNFMAAARPEQAQRLYNHFNRRLTDKGYTVETGIFGAMMQIHLLNDGPVTLILDSKNQ